uniref:Uncharacterized protein n=1 Tax=Helianthus annuus TaxID=4232 RepID=A0A251S379_HELAN
MFVVAKTPLYFRISKKLFHWGGNASANFFTTSAVVVTTPKLFNSTPYPYM